VLVERPDPSRWLSRRSEMFESSSSKKEMSRVVLGRRVEVLLLADWKKGCLGVSLMVVALINPSTALAAWEAAERMWYAMCGDDRRSASWVAVHDKVEIPQLYNKVGERLRAGVKH
jgi:hypothetical protein